MPCDSGQRREKESIFALPRSCHRQPVEQSGLLHLVQKDKNLEAREPLSKRQFDPRQIADEALKILQSSSCALNSFRQNSTTPLFTVEGYVLC